MPVESPTLTLFHLENDPLLAELLGRLIREWPEVCYLGHETSDARGLAECSRQKPSIVLLDLGISDSDGFNLVEAVAALAHQPRIVLLTARRDEVMLFRFSSSKAAGLVWKTAHSHEQLRAALQTVADGGSFFPQELLNLLTRFRNSPEAFFKILSPTEQTLLPYFGRALSDEEIAASTNRQPATVKWHRRRILTRLGLHQTSKLMLWVRERGFVFDPHPAPPCSLAG